ncbi:helix-turn-helix transcriptional regulator [Staphylococcus xylosus]|uniref:helix-turn-helix transcriptional regulator n=1 Tax=Staphylococcus xylosus TaxID=1288 RepID=UPI001C3EBA78|nr:helix-turn-helix transcriptional regulator [Staphylococcus xylosus]
MQWNLIKIRKEKECTQEDIAKLLNISTEGYRLKEAGKNQFKSDEMFILAKFFDENIGDIFLPTMYTKCKLSEKENIKKIS